MVTEEKKERVKFEDAELVIIEFEKSDVITESDDNAGTWL